MKQLLLATATLVGMSAAALAAEPVALTDSQLDNVTAGASVTTLLTPVTVAQAGATAGVLPFAPFAPIAVVQNSGAGINLANQTTINP